MTHTFGEYNVNNNKEKLTPAERVRYAPKLCKGCGKELPIIHGRRLYHDECSPDAVKKENWRK